MGTGALMSDGPQRSIASIIAMSRKARHATRAFDLSAVQCPCRNGAVEQGGRGSMPTASLDADVVSAWLGTRCGGLR